MGMSTNYHWACCIVLYCAPECQPVYLEKGFSVPVSRKFKPKSVEGGGGLEQKSIEVLSMELTRVTET